MTVTRQRFQQVAANLAQNVFGDFFIERTFTMPGGGYDPITGTTTPGATFTAPMLREEYSAKEIDNNIILSGDFKLLGEVAEFGSNDPLAAGLTVDVDGVQCRIVHGEKDAADAMWTLQVRRL